jgi:hypothetical protein
LPNAKGRNTGLSLRSDEGLLTDQSAPAAQGEGVEAPGTPSSLSLKDEKKARKREKTRRKKEKKTEKKQKQTEASASKPPASPEQERIKSAMDEAHKTTEKVRSPKAVLGWLMFLLVGGILVGLLHYGSEGHPEFLQYYRWARVASWAIVGLILLLVAFEDSTVQGLFCLFIPLYVIYYVFVRCDSHLLRGAFLGVLVSLFAELHYLSSGAIIITVQNIMNNVIDSGNFLIDEASKAPTY